MSHEDTRETPSEGRDAVGPNRRTVLKAGAVALTVGGAGIGAALVRAQESTLAATPTTCVLTPELTEGPYYLPLELVRSDITEDREGVPLQLRIAVQDITACAPLADAAVDVWHCDAQGYYSGVTGEPGGGASAEAGAGAETGTFLRGVQMTDADGVAEFQTVYPGWYTGRTVHIHMKVYADGAPDDSSDETVTAAHTGQLFFDDAISDAVYAEGEAYAGRDNDQRLRNEDDNIFGDHDDEPGFLVELTPLVEGSVTDGFVGTITIGVDPTATPTAVNGGGGQAPGEGGPGGPPPGEPGSTPPTDG